LSGRRLSLPLRGFCRIELLPTLSQGAFQKVTIATGEEAHPFHGEPFEQAWIGIHSTEEHGPKQHLGSVLPLPDFSALGHLGQA